MSFPAIERIRATSRSKTGTPEPGRCSLCLEAGRRTEGGGRTSGIQAEGNKVVTTESFDMEITEIINRCLNRRKRRQQRGRAGSKAAAGPGCGVGKAGFLSLKPEAAGTNGPFPLCLWKKGQRQMHKTNSGQVQLRGTPPAYLAEARARATGRLAYASGWCGGRDACRKCYQAADRLNHARNRAGDEVGDGGASGRLGIIADTVNRAATDRIWTNSSFFFARSAQQARRFCRPYRVEGTLKRPIGVRCAHPVDQCATEGCAR